MSFKVGTIVNGTVTGITNFGAFVELEDARKGMIHISEISRSYVEDIKSVLKVGQAVSCKVISVSPEGKVALSLKQMDDAEGGKKPSKKPPQKKPAERPKRTYEPGPAVTSPGDFEWQSSANSGSFEDMMSKF